MIDRVRPLLLPVGFLVALVAATTLLGYVYSHEPARDTLTVAFEGTPPPQPTYVIGAVATVEGDTVRLDVGAGGSREVSVSADTPVEDLERLDAPPADGTTVNVGVDDTSFGQVLTGIVAIEEAR